MYKFFYKLIILIEIIFYVTVAIFISTILTIEGFVELFFLSILANKFSKLTLVKNILINVG